MREGSEEMEAAPTTRRVTVQLPDEEDTPRAASSPPRRTVETLDPIVSLSEPEPTEPRRWPRCSCPAIKPWVKGVSMELFTLVLNVIVLNFSSSRLTESWVKSLLEYEMLIFILLFFISTLTLTCLRALLSFSVPYELLQYFRSLMLLGSSLLVLVEHVSGLAIFFVCVTALFLPISLLYAQWVKAQRIAFQQVSVADQEENGESKSLPPSYSVAAVTPPSYADYLRMYARKVSGSFASLRPSSRTDARCPCGDHPPEHCPAYDSIFGPAPPPSCPVILEEEPSTSAGHSGPTTPQSHSDPQLTPPAPSEPPPEEPSGNTETAQPDATSDQPAEQSHKSITKAPNAIETGNQGISSTGQTERSLITENYLPNLTDNQEQNVAAT